MSDRAAAKVVARGVSRLGFVAGPVLGAVVYALLPDTYGVGAGAVAELGHAGRATAGVAVWMGVWWMTEAIPLYATSLLPLAVLPTVGATAMRATAAAYGHELIFLFMGGFILALAMQRWGLDQRVALMALRLVGTRPDRIVAGFMAITAVFSMWVSNTATAVMMLPIAISVIDLLERRDAGSAGARSGPPAGFPPALLLGIAYAASIGGIGTLIGTPPNLFLASFIRDQYGVEISFVRWMAVGLPLVAIFLPLVWLLLTRILHPIRVARIEGGEELARSAYAGLGPLKTGEWVTFVVFVLTASAWIFRPLLGRIAWSGVHPFAGLTDPGIAMLGALVLFLVPAGRGERVMDWETAVRLPWGLLVLFGGGLSLAAAIRDNGVGEFLGHQVGGLAGLPPAVLVVGVVALMIFLTELTSNTATAATLIPILAALAPGLHVSPVLLIVPATMAASCAFMLPVATPPNAVVFGSGRISVGEMCRAGIWLNLIGIALISALAFALVVRVLGALAG